MSSTLSYEQVCAAHRWEVPERYNIAADVCDRHPRNKLAMVHEDFQGTVRRVSWGEIQDNSNRFANVLVAWLEREGRVHEVQINLVEPEPAEAPFKCCLHSFGAVIRIPKFCRDENVLAFQPGAGPTRPKCFAHLLLVPVPLCAIEVAEARIKRVQSGGKRRGAV